MSEMSMPYEGQPAMVADEAFGELLDDLYSLLDDVSNPVKLKANIMSLIHRIEDRIAGDEEGEAQDTAGDWELTTSYAPEFSLLIQQAQQQNQQ